MKITKWGTVTVTESSIEVVGFEWESDAHQNQSDAQAELLSVVVKKLKREIQALRQGPDPLKLVINDE